MPITRRDLLILGEESETPNYDQHKCKADLGCHRKKNGKTYLRLRLDPMVSIALVTKVFYLLGKVKSMEGNPCGIGMQQW